MLRIVSLNVNGLRSATRKGFLDWLATSNADIVCMQELKALESDLDDAQRNPPGYHGHFFSAVKKGYSGVGLYIRNAADATTTGFESEEFDPEGRILRADWPGLSVVSAYLPSGSSGDERQAAKYRFLDHFAPWLASLMEEHRATGREFVICGDWNIAHREADLKNWKSNQKNSGFLPEERAWLSRVFDELGFVDVYRTLHPDTTDECYTWWSNRGQAWAKNVGWRLDYQIATPGIAARARSTSVYKETRFSDHAPLTVDYATDV